MTGPKFSAFKLRQTVPNTAQYVTDVLVSYFSNITHTLADLSILLDGDHVTTVPDTYLFHTIEFLRQIGREFWQWATFEEKNRSLKALILAFKIILN